MTNASLELFASRENSNARRSGCTPYPPFDGGRRHHTWPKTYTFDTFSFSPIFYTKQRRNDDMDVDHRDRSGQACHPPELPSSLQCRNAPIRGLKRISLIYPPATRTFRVNLSSDVYPDVEVSGLPYTGNPCRFILKGSENDDDQTAFPHSLVIFSNFSFAGPGLG